MTRRGIALLRGINVGGHRKVPMADLRALLAERLGLTDVATYIQSGNVAFDAPAGSLDGIDTAISAAVLDHYGFEVPIIVRDAEVLPPLLTRSGDIHPVTDAATHDKRAHIGFLTGAPSADAIAAIDPDRSPGDSVVVDGDHAFVHFAVGAGTTKLTGDYLERVLGVGMTMRNLATVRRLAVL